MKRSKFVTLSLGSNTKLRIGDQSVDQATHGPDIALLFASFSFCSIQSRMSEKTSTTNVPANKPSIGLRLLGKKRAKAVVAAVVLSLVTLYTSCDNRHYQEDLDVFGEFEYNVTKALPRGGYTLCSAGQGGRSVYMVDEGSGVVECVLVAGEWIKGSGTLSELASFSALGT